MHRRGSGRYRSQAIGDVASNPAFVVIWIALTGGTGGAGDGLGTGPL